MPESLQQVLTFILIPVVATIIGAVVAAFYTPPPTVRSAIQHLAAGVVFAAVAGELLPEVREQDPLAVIVGFALGVGAMLAIRHFAGHGEETGKVEGESSMGLIVTVGVDLVVDGLLIGIGFAAGAEQGILLTIALTLEVLFLGLTTAIALSEAGASNARVIGIPSGLALLLGLAAVVGILLLGGLSGFPFAVVLAFGAAALLYLVTEELLIEAHEVPETPVTAAMFFVGFLALFIIEMVA